MKTLVYESFFFSFKQTNSYIFLLKFFGQQNAPIYDVKTPEIYSLGLLGVVLSWFEGVCLR